MQLTKMTQIKSQEKISGKFSVYFKLGAYALITAVEHDLTFDCAEDCLQASFCPK